MSSDYGRRPRFEDDRRDVERKRGLRRSRSREATEKARSPDRKRRREQSRSRSGSKETSSRFDTRRIRDERQRVRSGSVERKERDKRKEKEPSIKLPRRRESEEKTVFATPVMSVDDDDGTMAAMMGFSSFDTTKGKKVEGNDTGMASLAVKRKYRQYMNRRGGFNRPLDPVH